MQLQHHCIAKHKKLCYHFEELEFISVVNSLVVLHPLEVRPSINQLTVRSLTPAVNMILQGRIPIIKASFILYSVLKRG